MPMERVVYGILHSTYQPCRDRRSSGRVVGAGTFPGILWSPVCLPDTLPSYLHPFHIYKGRLEVGRQVSMGLRIGKNSTCVLAGMLPRCGDDLGCC